MENYMENKILVKAKMFRILVTRFFAFFLLLYIIFFQTSWPKSMAPIAYAVAILFITAGAFGRIWASLFIAGYKNKELITTGPYARIRNPLYFFSFVDSIGLGIASQSFVVFGLILAGFVIYYPFVMAGEEAKLERLHGEKFRAYKKQTPRFFPKIGKVPSIPQYTVKCRQFLSAFYDAFWFYAVLSILMILHWLHQAEILPAYFHW